MAERMTFVLDGRDDLSRVLNRAGDSADRLDRRISGAMGHSNQATQRFTQDANGRLHDMQGRFVSAGAAATQFGAALGGVASSSTSAGGALGSSGGSMLAVAGILGTALLPAIGALVPMLAGAGVAVGTLKLGFQGIGTTMALAGTDQKKYAEALAKLPAPARDFTKALVGLKKEFSGLAGPIQKAMLPSFTKAVKAAGPLVDILGKSMTQLAGGFGDAAAGAARLMKDSGFQKDFGTTLKLGTGFVKDLTGSLGPLVRTLLDFGAASGPTLKAFSSGISGLLGKGGGGLVGFFDGLKTGISGSAGFLNGLFDMITRVLPAIGRFGGEFARALGPLFGQASALAGRYLTQALDHMGLVMKALSPVFKDLGYGIKAVNDVMSLIGPTITDTVSAIVGGLLPSFGEVDKARGPFQRLSDLITNNRGAILEMARMVGNAFIDMVSVAVNNLPTLVTIFSIVTAGIVTALGGALHAAASMFDWLPGVGGKLKSADAAFSKFKTSYISGLAAAEAKSTQFAASVGPKLSSGQLKMTINNWNAQIATAKAQLKSLPPSKTAAVKAQIADLQSKVKQARAALDALNGKTAQTFIKTIYQYYTKQPTASGPLASGFVPSGHADGGLIRGPGTGTSDSILRRVSNNEYVVKASSVAKYGVGFMNELNAGRLSTAAGGPSAGAMAGAGQEAGRGLASGLTGSVGQVDTAARVMAAAVTAGIRAELQIASPSKKTRALAADVGAGFIVGLTGSKAKITSVTKDLAKDIWAAWKGSKSTKDSQLVAMVYRDNSKLQKLASQRDSLAARIAAAKTYASSLTTTARQGAELGSLGIADGEVTAGSIQAGMAGKLAQIKQFSRYVSDLAKKGLHKTLIRQILAMGPDAGYAYASALDGASSSALKAINLTQHGLDTATASLGNTGADIMYDAGANAGKGFLTGLTSQQKAIEAQMTTIAKGMQKAIKKALGIKSPSRVMAEVGRYSTEGLAVGLKERLPVLDQALNAVSGRVASTQPVIGAPAYTAGGGGGVTNIYIQIDGALDTTAVAKQMEKVLLKLARTRGGKVNLAGVRV